MKILLPAAVFFLVLFPLLSYSQCCSGGAGSPLAGGTSQGVLNEKQLELNSNIQFVNSDQFYSGSKKTSENYFDEFSSLYQYFRLAYGVTSKLTFSVETGNYFFKKETGLNGDDEKTYKSGGMSDLIIFPRYQVLKICTEKTNNEITLGMGFKIPLGSYNDSTARIEPFSGDTYYVINPQAVQLTTGAQDMIFYGFYVRAYPKKNLRFFSNMLYIKKGWNPLGEKTGDFMSLGLFASKSFANHYGVTLQLRAEKMGKTKVNKDILMYSFLNYDPEATGYHRIFISPQFMYTWNNLAVYALLDYPVYQFLNKIQVGSKWQATAGISYKLNL